MELFKILGKIAIDNSDANKNIDETSGKAEGFGTKLKNGIGTVAKWSAAIVTGASAAVAGMASVANKAAQQADEIDKASIRMGISAEAYQKYAYAAELAGVSTSELETAAKKLEGTDINFDDAMNSIMALGTEEERTAAAIDLFGEKVAYGLSPILQQSADEFNATKQEAEDLGLVLSGDDVKAGAELNDQITKLTDTFNMLGTKLGVALMPIVEDLVNWILDYMPTIQGIFDQLAPVLMDLLDGLIPPLMDLIDQLLPILVDLIEQLLPPIVDLLTGILPVAVSILNIILPILVQIIDAVLPVIVNLLNVLLPVLEPIISLLDPIFQILMLLLSPLLTLIDLILPPLTELINLVAQTINTILMPIFEKLQEWVQTFVTWLKEKMVEKLQDVFNKITAKLKYAWQYLQLNARNIKKKIQEWMENAKKVVVDKFTEIKDKIKDIFDKAKEVVSDAIEKIKGFFKFDWELPKLKMPHFSISGSFSLDPPSIPTIGVDWYAKAMDDPMIMNSPTAFGINNLGQIMAGGEAGSEVVSGTDTLMEMIREAVSSSGNATQIAILEELKKLNGGLYSNIVEALKSMQVKFDDRELARLVRKYA